LREDILPSRHETVDVAVDQNTVVLRRAAEFRRVRDHQCIIRERDAAQRAEQLLARARFLSGERVLAYDKPGRLAR
jgi:hypothetical protein